MYARWLMRAGLVLLVLGALLVVCPRGAAATGLGRCETITLHGQVRDVACSPWRCTGTLSEGSSASRAYTVRSALFERWAERSNVSATYKVCR